MQEALESTFYQRRGLYDDTALSANNTVLSALQRLVPASQTDYSPVQEIGIRYAVNGLPIQGGTSKRSRRSRHRMHVSSFPVGWVRSNRGTGDGTVNVYAGLEGLAVLGGYAFFVKPGGLVRQERQE